MDKTNIHELAKSMTSEDFAYMLESRCNSFHMDTEDGIDVGLMLQSSHRTLQATAFRYLMGIIMGLGKGIAYTDARNEVAVNSSKQIAKMVEDGELWLGHMI